MPEERAREREPRHGPFDFPSEGGPRVPRRGSLPYGRRTTHRDPRHCVDRHEGCAQRNAHRRGFRRHPVQSRSLVHLHRSGPLPHGRHVQPEIRHRVGRAKLAAMNVPAQSPRKGALIFILVTVVIDMRAFGMIIPVLPMLVQNFVGGNAARAAEMYGLFGTAWALMQFIFSPVQGSLSDHFGRRPVILISCAGLGLDFILMALAPNLWWLLVGSGISGITAARFGTADPYISVVARPEERAASFGVIGPAVGIGLVLGAALG